MSGEDPDAADDIGSDLTRQITRLERMLVRTDKQDVLDENRDLLGSAEKRLAELLFRQFGEGRDDDSRAALARLAMLASLIDVDPFESAEAYLQEMKTRVAALPTAPTHDPLASTRAQFQRYVDWWRHDNGYFPGSIELAAHATRLAGMLLVD